MRIVYCTLVRVVGLTGENSERAQIETVAVLKKIEIVILYRNADNVRDECTAARCRTYPRNVVISPLDIDVVHFHQLIENNIGARSAVKNVADYVELVDGKRLYQLAE